MSDQSESLPLSGLRVLSFEQFGAAPYATMFLADLGAEVIKAELPEGDFARRTAPLTLGTDDSLYFQSLNLNKKSVVLNLAEPAGRELFERLVPSCDIVVNNLRGGSAAKLGLDYQSLRSVRPSIICGHISAFGRGNSRAKRPGFDFLMQAEAGLMALTGDPGTPPNRVGVSIIDYMTGMMLALGVLSAVLRAKRTGIGADVDACLFDTALHQLGYQATWYLNANIVTARTPRSAHPSNTPVQLFKTADGWVYLACMTENFWRGLTGRLGVNSLAVDPLFVTQELRLKNRDKLTERLDRIFMAHPSEHWVDLLSDDVPISPVLDLPAALDSPFVQEAEMIGEVTHPQATILRVLSNPIRLDGLRLPRKCGPALGEHTELVHRSLGEGQS